MFAKAETLTSGPRTEPGPVPLGYGEWKLTWQGGWEGDDFPSVCGDGLAPLICLLTFDRKASLGRSDPDARHLAGNG